MESVKSSGVNQPALVRHHEGGGYEIIAGHRRQKASELAGYRGFLDNEGPTGVCKLEEQVEDIRNAVVFVQTLPQVDAARIGLIGWGMAAALVMGAAAKEPAVRAVAGLNGFYNGRKWLQKRLRLRRLCGAGRCHRPGADPHCHGGNAPL